MVLDPLKRDIEAMISSLLIDWSEVEKFPKLTCECKCHPFASGITFMSHAKYVGPPINRMVSKTPCPSCGLRANLRRTSSEWGPG